MNRKVSLQTACTLQEELAHTHPYLRIPYKVHTLYCARVHERIQIHYKSTLKPGHLTLYTIPETLNSTHLHCKSCNYYVVIVIKVYTHTGKGYSIRGCGVWCKSFTTLTFVPTQTCCLVTQHVPCCLFLTKESTWKVCWLDQAAALGILPLMCTDGRGGPHPSQYLPKSTFKSGHTSLGPKCCLLRHGLAYGTGGTGTGIVSETWAWPLSAFETQSSFRIHLKHTFSCRRPLSTLPPFTQSSMCKQAQGENNKLELLRYTGWYQSSF